MLRPYINIDYNISDMWHAQVVLSINNNAVRISREKTVAGDQFTVEYSLKQGEIPGYVLCAAQLMTESAHGVVSGAARHAFE